jgi:hypothetical protein
MKKKLVKIINLNEEATSVASPRSRAGQKEQDEFTKRLTTLMQGLEKEVQLEVEPNVNTINNIINKKDKKKFN